MKKFLVITSAVLLLAAACNKQAAVQPAPNQTTNTDQTANWKTYSNTKYGFEFKYPENWVVEERVVKWDSYGDVPTVYVTNKQLKFNVETSGGTSPEWNVNYIKDTFGGSIDKFMSNTDEYTKSLRKVTKEIDTRETYSITTNYQDYRTVFANGYVFMLQGPKTAGFQGGGSDIEAIYKNILSSFKFTTPVSTTNWKTYTNAQYGFEFKYPSDLVVVQEGGTRLGSTGIVYSVKYPDSKWSYSVDVKTNTTKETLAQAFNENYTYMKQLATPTNLDFQLKDYYTSDIKVNGLNAKELYIDHFSDVGSTMVSVVTNKNVYLIAGGTHKGDLDQFLSTFKFTK